MEGRTEEVEKERRKRRTIKGENEEDEQRK